MAAPIARHRAGQLTAADVVALASAVAPAPSTQATASPSFPVIASSLDTRAELTGELVTGHGTSFASQSHIGDEAKRAVPAVDE